MELDLIFEDASVLFNSMGFSKVHGQVIGYQVAYNKGDHCDDDCLFHDYVFRLSAQPDLPLSSTRSKSTLSRASWYE